MWRRLGLRLSGLVAAVLLAGAMGLSSARADGNGFYAYAGGSDTAPAGCAPSDSAGGECSLAEALSQAGAGDTIYLAGPASGSSASEYVGNWTVSPAGTSTDAPLTIAAAPGVAPTLAGTGDANDPCETSACDESILSIDNGAWVTLQGLSFTAGNAPDGGAINNEGGSTLTVSDSSFSSNTATDDGGAIASGVHGGSGTLIVTGSTFSSNDAAAYGGGAIDSGEFDGTGSLSVSDSTFAFNTSLKNGGAIDTGDDSGTGTASVSDSSFVSNSTGYDGGAIASGDNSGTGTLAVTGSTFVSNVAGGGGGGAIENGGPLWEGVGPATGTATVTDSTLISNTAVYGGAIDNGAASATGTLTVTGSTFAGNAATTAGDTIDNSRGGSGGTVNAAADVFSGTCVQGAGAWNDGGYNVGTDTSCENGATTDSSSLTSAELGPLADNGGPTQTADLLAGNPAITLIPVSASAGFGGASVALCPRADQRGVSSDASCSSGAVEDLLFLAGPASTSATAGSAYTGTVSAAGGLGHYSYAVAPGSALPAGLSLNPSSGQISGVPSQLGTITTTIQARDARTGETGLLRVSFMISAVPAATTSAAGTGVGAVSAPTPTITAKIISAHAKTRYGWYRSAVEVTFACSAGGATLTNGCPQSVTLTRSARNQSVTRTIITSTGARATVTVGHIDIDRTLPIITIRGVRPGHIYARLPTATCSARDKLADVVSCRVRETIGAWKASARARIVTYRARAVTRAGRAVTEIRRIYLRYRASAPNRAGAPKL